MKKIVIVGSGTAGLISALFIRQKYPFIDIQVISSSNIGIIGVGEGSTDIWYSFCEYVGIDIKTLITNTDATLKAGIVFENWNGDNKSYVHSVDSLSMLSKHKRHDHYYHSVLHRNNYYPLSLTFDYIFSKGKIPIDTNILSTKQYHFDTYKLNNFLVRVCQERNIDFLDEEVLKSNVDGNGLILSLTLKSGKEINGDFFVDCSGFKRVLNNVSTNKWISHRKFLPLDCAITFQTEFDSDNIEPFTKSTALKNGWLWKIPTQQRYGNGYVFCSSYTNSNEARKEVITFLNKDIVVGKEIKFEAGKLQQFWHGNCLFVGLSGSFAEPLEAQSIGFIINQVFKFIEMFEAWETNRDFISKSYNKIIDDCFDNVVNYLQIHYFTKRSDTKFWAEKPFELTDFNKQTFQTFSSGYIQPYFFNEYDLFKSANFFQVYFGLGLIKRESICKITNSNREFFNDSIKQYVLQYANRNVTYIKHKQLLDMLYEVE